MTLAQVCWSGAYRYVKQYVWLTRTPAVLAKSSPRVHLLRPIVVVARCMMVGRAILGKLGTDEHWAQATVHTVASGATEGDVFADESSM